MATSNEEIDAVHQILNLITDALEMAGVPVHDAPTLEQMKGLARRAGHLVARLRRPVTEENTVLESAGK